MIDVVFFTMKWLVRTHQPKFISRLCVVQIVVRLFLYCLVIKCSYLNEVRVRHLRWCPLRLLWLYSVTDGHLHRFRPFYKYRIIDSRFHAKATVDLVHAINGLKSGHPHIVLGWRYLGSQSHSGHFLWSLFRRLLYVRDLRFCIWSWPESTSSTLCVCFFHSRSSYAPLEDASCA